MDRYFTSTTLARWATKKNITRVGTMQLDCKGILKDFWDIRHCQEKSTEFIYGQDEGEENIMLTSCCDKKASVTRMWWY